MGAWIGAVTATLTPEEAKRMGLKPVKGAVVARVFGGSPAQAAGLKAGDVITSVSGRAVDSREAFSTYTATLPSGHVVDVTVKIRLLVPPDADRKPTSWVFAELSKRIGVPLMNNAELAAQLPDDFTDDDVLAVLAASSRVLWEQVRWLDTYLKSARPRPAPRLTAAPATGAPGGP